MKSLTDFDKYKVVRPVIGGCEYDQNDFPIIRNTFPEDFDWNNIRACGIQNIKKSQTTAIRWH